MAKSVTYVSDIPGDEGANVETLSFRIPAATSEGRPMQVTIDVSEDIRRQFDEATSNAHEAYVKDLTKRLQFITKHAKVTEVKPSESKAEGTYNGDRAVNKAIREWAADPEGGNMADKLPASGRGRVNEDVKAAFWTAVSEGKVADPRKGVDNGEQESSGEE